MFKALKHMAPDVNYVRLSILATRSNRTLVTYALIQMASEAANER